MRQTIIAPCHLKKWPKSKKRGVKNFFLTNFDFDKQSKHDN